MLQMGRCHVVVLLGLVLLCYSLEPLLEDLDHVVTLLLLIDKLFVEDLVDTRDRFLDLGEHLLKLTLELRHDMVGHCLLELVVDHLPD